MWVRAKGVRAIGPERMGLSDEVRATGSERRGPNNAGGPSDRGLSNGSRALWGSERDWDPSAWGGERSGSKRWSTMAEVAMPEGLTVTEHCSVTGIIDQAGAGRG
jgi:hypothetical protein